MSLRTASWLISSSACILLIDRDLSNTWHKAIAGKINNGTPLQSNRAAPSTFHWHAVWLTFEVNYTVESRSECSFTAIFNFVSHGFRAYTVNEVRSVLAESQRPAAVLVIWFSIAWLLRMQKYNWMLLSSAHSMYIWPSLARKNVRKTGALAGIYDKAGKCAESVFSSISEPRRLLVISDLVF